MSTCAISSTWTRWDVLNFAIGLHERLGVDIPEVDYPKLLTLSGAVSYLAAKLASSSVPAPISLRAPQ
jgi:hypothetical protein